MASEVKIYVFVILLAQVHSLPTLIAVYFKVSEENPKLFIYFQFVP